ncbi:hypothetical protein MNBD_PLANCTO02-2547 [hydrothermal vent metagenome]|uniref:Uncharacterized protein n=1 Tax=hydrothermal vent metagenome TaxID=652676 RepID=A0A3B1DU41_9ZZZZ
MHITGKLMIFLLLIPLAATSVWMSARLYVVRNSWSKQVEDLAVKNIKGAHQINENEKRLKHLKDELARTMLSWGQNWDNVDAEGFVRSGRLIIETSNFGANQGIASRSAKPVLHVFRPEKDGVYSYLGPFRATTVRPQEASFEPTWKYRPVDVLNLEAGKWRFRSLIPSGHFARIDQLEAQLWESAVKLRDYQIEVAEQKKIIGKSEEALETRLGELLGNPAAKNIPGSPEFSKGYVATIDLEQQARNLLLDELDKLRRQVKIEYDRMMEKIQENKQLASQASDGGTPPIKTTEKKTNNKN